MELPVPQLSTLETITVVFLCFVAVQVAIGRKRIAESWRVFWFHRHLRFLRDINTFDVGGDITRDGGPNLIVTAASQPKYVPNQEDWTPEQIARFQSHYVTILSDGVTSQPKCPTPPEGWDCSRDIGHPGPCAASPSKSSASEGDAS